MLTPKRKQSAAVKVWGNGGTLEGIPTTLLKRPHPDSVTGIPPEDNNLNLKHFKLF